MTIAEQLERAKTDLDDVYEAGYNKGLNDAPPSGDYQDGFAAGKQAEYDAFWDGYQDGGNRRNYQYVFAGTCWNDATFKPKYDIILGAGYSGTFMFYEVQVSNLSETLERLGITLDTTLCGFFSNMFQRAQTMRVPVINATNAMAYNKNGLYYTFQGSTVETIDKLIVTESLKYADTFNGCTNLKNIKFEGTIGQSIGFAQSNLLTVASMDSIYAALKDYTSNPSAYTLTLHASAWARWDAAKPDLVSQYGSMKNYVTTTKGWATS